MTQPGPHNFTQLVELTTERQRIYLRRQAGESKDGDVINAFRSESHL